MTTYRQCFYNSAGELISCVIVSPDGTETGVFGEEDFAFDGAFPVDLAILGAGGFIDKVEFVVEVAFDDPAATLKIGTVAAPELVFAAVDTDLTILEQYVSEVNHRILADDILRLVIEPGASTQGSGYVNFVLRSG